MQLETLPTTTIAHAMERIDLFLAVVDGDGTLHERRTSRAGRLPEDLSSADPCAPCCRPRCSPSGCA